MSKDTLDLKRFTEEAKSLVAHAQHLADDKHHVEVDPTHILVYALDNLTEVVLMFKECKADTDLLLKSANLALTKMKTGTNPSNLSTQTLGMFNRLGKEVKSPNLVSVEDIIGAIVALDHGAAFQVFKSCSISSSDMKSKENKTPRFTSDLLAKAKAGKFDPVVGRDKEVRRLFQILGRRTKNNPLLIGESGVGKTAIVNALATRLATKDAPANLHQLTVLELELNSVMAGARARGEVDERLKKVLLDIQPNTVLVISNLENLFTSNGISGTSDILKSVMSKPNIHLLASTTVDGSKKIADKDPGLMTGFSQIFIDPSSPDQAKEMIRAVASRYEEHHKVAIGANAIESAVRLAKRYLQDRPLPGSAVELLDEAAARKRMEMTSLPGAIDDAMRRLESLKLQRSGLVDKGGVLRADFASDGASVKTLKSLDAEITKVESELEALEEGASAGERVAALRSEVASVAGKLALADSSQMEALTSELAALKARLVEAEKKASLTVEKPSVMVSEENLAAVLNDWTGISAQQMCESEMEKLSKMEAQLTRRVMGQPEAVSLVSKAIRRSRLGLRDANKPIGSFLFLGSSGVGKTELAKALAEFLFDDESNIVRLDMSEFQEAHMVSRLLGSPQGYQDSSEGGMLTSAIQKTPYSVLLVDELEKGNPNIFLLFLQILSEAKLSDARGNVVDFSNTVVIFTSNIGTKQLLDAPREKFATAEGREELSLMVRNQLKEQMRPELINRLDNVVLFNPLEKPTLKGIIDIRLRELDRMLESRELTVRLTNAAKDQIVEEGYEPSFGARPISRALVSRVRDPLADELMAGGYAPGTIISVDYTDGLFSFSKSAA